MQKLAQISEQILLLTPGDSAAKQVAAMLDEMSKETSLSEASRTSAVAAAKLARKLATKKSADKDLSALLELLSKIEAAETRKDSALPADLVAEYLASQESVLADFEEEALGLEQGGEQTLRALRRQVHTWKGESGIIGADKLAAALHKIEDALDQVRPEQFANVSDAMLALKDLMTKAFADLRVGQAADLNAAHVLSLFVQDAAPTNLKLTAPESVLQPVVVVPQIETPPQPAAETREDTSHGIVDGYFIIGQGVDAEFVVEFQAEAEEHFTTIETGLMTMEAEPGDAEAVNAVFRAFHTVKGVASFVGVSYVTELAHKAENLLDRVRKGTLSPNSTVVDLVLESMDLLRKLIQTLPGAIADGRYPVPKNYISLLQRLEHPELAQSNAPSRAEGAAAPAEDAPTSEPDELPTNKASEPQASPESAMKSESPAAAAVHVVDATVKVGMSRLDNLINMVGELVIAQAMVSQDPEILTTGNRKLSQNVAQLAKITRSLQELALSMRMISVKPTFQKMARLVRDVARKSNKQVEFEMTGDDTELDRNMVEAIADPLVHMVRNAVDHGIEPAEDRVKNGKSRSGLVRLSAAHEGGSVVITLSDDGRGLNRDKIIAKAIERGLVEPGALLTEKEIYNLVFLPGFSTADKITDVSGRGVGMDVVRTNIEKLRGSVEIDSVPGQGSVFRVRLPLTLAIIDGMVLKVGSQRFIIPTISITKSFQPRPQDIVTIHGKGELVQLRGSLLPVCRLHGMYDIGDSGRSLTDAILIVAEAKSGHVAIMADALLGQQQVVIKSLGSMFDGTEGVAGCAILGDGRISLILDVDGLLNVCQQSAAPQILEIEGARV